MGCRYLLGVTALRSLVLRRLVTGAALLGLLLPLAPAAQARDAASERLAGVLGHREAVEEALAVAQHAADPTAAFAEAYEALGGLDVESVLARLGGDALWLLIPPPEPTAVLVPTAASLHTSDSPLASAVLPPMRRSLVLADGLGVPSGSPEASEAPLAPALQPRGP